MKLIDELFDRYKLKNTRCLEDFGFCATGSETLAISKVIEHEMRLDVEIKNGKVSGKIIDENFADEFVQIDDEQNAYAKMLNDKCIPLLLEIRDACFYKTNFILPQSLRVEAYILQKYEVKPEFLWNNAPGFGVFRKPKTKKWFAIIMNIDKGKFKKDSKGMTEIINLKLDNECMKLVGEKGIYPSWHMNKKNWITAELNGDIADDLLFSLISISYDNS